MYNIEPVHLQFAQALFRIHTPVMTICILDQWQQRSLAAEAYLVAPGWPQVLQVLQVS